ncbi:T9SS type B sorting domain-containing protein [Ancylomarina salipaludis]|uniref:T9SS type B sorting domain-containing protein n=1 Tax=Ancylomarina salipaludis TaxID=2501299 RepID=A0A4Q1JPX3_9BACT|nr:gliding motility-associated C-terminal domain-containing protein [Ancylomarina salipaludis]RXQ96784.1 T9SS type B sorting domain-containing protein [Ancylomarina salipaludis]
MDTNTVNDKRALLTSSLLLRLFVILVFSLLAPQGFAQLDYIHYIPPLYDGSNSDNDIGRNVVVITTDSRDLIDVWIYKGDNNLLAQIQVSRYQPYRYTFETSRADNYGFITSYPTDYEFPFGVVGANDLNKVLVDAGLKFVSYDAPIYVNMRHVTEDQGGSLTTKGRFAMGKEFRTGHVYTANVGATFRRAHFFSVMATEDNTTVKFTDIKTEVLSQLVAGSIEPLPISALDTITVLLQKGQSYVIGIDHDVKGFDTGNMNALNGSHILSDKDIVVNTGSWTSGSSAGQDMGIDQIVPYDQVRDKYIVLKGEGNSSTEVPIVVATEDGTDIYLNGSSTPINSFPLNAGEFYLITTGNYYDNKVYIDTKGKNVYVYQTLSGSSSKIGPTVGMNFIAPLSATGMHQVDIPFADKLAEESVNSVITILAQNGATVKYENIINGVTTEREFLPSESSAILGTDEWVSYRMDAVVGNIRFQSSRALNVCWTVQTGVVGSAGYYSGFSKAIPKIIPDLHVDMQTDLSVICESFNDNIVVDFVSTPDPDFYEWYRNLVTADSLIFENEKLNVLAPDIPTTYILKAYYRDPSLDILYNGDFSSGRGNFETDYVEVSGNLREPGQFALTFSPQSENSAFEDFDDMEGGGLMFVAQSNEPGDTIYQKLDIPIERDYNYILKLHGRMAQLAKPQLIDVYVNDEIVKSNFLIDDVTAWQSVSCLWKSKDNQTATISLIDANASGDIGVFAIDSITFIPAVQDSAVFNALVVPNYSFTPYNKPQHFCMGQLSGNIDISNGDTSWYTYVWERKNGENDYIPIAEPNVSGTDSYNLSFTNITADNAGIYRCSINFKEEYQQCGMTLEPAQVEVEVVVDELARIVSLTEQADLCEGESAALDVNVEGKYSRIAWSVNGVEKAEGKVFDFNLDKAYGAGVYTIRCDIENACEPLSREIEIEIFGKPNLTDLLIPSGLCDQTSADLTAIVGFVPVGASLEYSWYRDNNLIATNNLSVFSIIPDMSDSYYKVAVAARYNIGNVDEHTCMGNVLVKNLALDAVFPQVVLIPLDSKTLCEGVSYLYNTKLETSGDYYTYNWEVPVGVAGDKTNADFNLINITPDMAGDYKVTVNNRCGSDSSTSVLTVIPKLRVTDITIDKNSPYCDGEMVTIDVADNGQAKLYTAENTTIGQEQVVSPMTNPFSFAADNTNKGQWEITAEGNCGTIYQELFTINLLDSFSDPNLNDVTTCLGEDVSLEVQIETIPSGSGLTYAWTDPNGDPIVIADPNPKNIVNIVDVQADELGIYTCVVSNKCGYSKTVTANLDIESVTSALTAPLVEVCQGTANYRFEITTVGTPEFAWRFNDPDGTVISAESFYEIPVVEKANEGIYYCDITLACRTVLKYQRQLVVNEHITVVEESPATVDICQGEQAELRISTTGAVGTIQWFDNDDNELLAYAGKTRLSTGILNTPGTYTYKYQLTGDCENLNGDFDVVVHAKPSIEPIAQINACSGDVNLNMLVTSIDPATSSWWNADESLKLADGLSHTLTGVPYSGDLLSYVALTNTAYCGDVKTTAQVYIYKPIAVVSNSDLTPKPCVGEPLSLIVKGTGDNLSYNWFKTDAPAVTLSTSTILDLGPAELADQGDYRCELISGNGCGNLNVDFTVDVREHAKITLQPLAQTPCEDDASVIFKVAGIAEDSPSYQWYNDNILISDGGDFAGTTTTDLSVSNLLAHDTELFHCRVSGDYCDPVESDKVSLIVNRNITITNQPVAITIDENGSATFTIIAIGGDPISYQWYENGVSMGSTPASAQTASLTLTSVPLSKDGSIYYCKVTNLCDVEDSDPASLNVNIDNRIITQGLNTEACDGSSFSFTVDYKNTTTNCVWEYNDGTGFTPIGGLGTIINGVTSSTLTVTTATMAMDTWKFRALVQRTGYVDNVSNELEVKVYKQVDFDNIADATLCLNAGKSFAVTNLTGTGPFNYEWKRGATVLASGSSLNLNSAAAIDGGYSIEVGNNICSPTVKTFNIAHYADLVITGISSIDPVCENVAENLVVSITKDPALAETYTWTKDGNSLVGTTDTYTIDGTSTSQTGLYKVVVNDGCVTKSISSYVNVFEDIALLTSSPIATDLCEGEDLSLHVTGSGDNLSYNWYKTTAPATSLSTNETLNKLNMLAADAGVYRCDLTSASGCNTDFIEFTVNVGKHATIDNPLDVSMCQNTGNASFDVVATGEGDLTYKWYDNDILMGGEITASLSVNSLLTNNGHSYHCVVNGTSCDEAVSEKAVLTVKENVAVTKHPVNVSVADGGTAVFTVEASGTGPYFYLWYEDTGSGFAAMPTETSSTLTLSALLADNGNQYYCKVTGNCTSVNSNNALLTVDVNKRITSQAVNAEACIGDYFTFIVTYKNTTEACDWEYDSGSGYVAIGGLGSSNFTSTSSVLTVNSATLAMNSWKFRALVKEGILAPDISDEVEVKVYEPIDFNAIADETLCKNKGVSFTASGLSGTGPFSYEWKRDVTSIGTNSSLSLSGVDATDNTYSLGVSNGVCPATTKTFNISHYADLVIDGITDIDPVCENVAENLSVSITKDPALSDTYIWTKDGGALVGTTNTYTIDGSSTSQTGLYKVVVNDGCMTKSISSFVNVLKDVALSTSSPLTSNLCEGENLSLHVTGSGDNLSYNWYKTTDPATSLSTSETLDISNVFEVNSGIYRCDLTSASGCNTDFIEFTVNVRKHATVNNPIDDFICEGTGNASFNIIATGNGTIVYQWYENDVLIPAATTSTLSVASLLANDGNSYHCVVNGDFCDEAVSEKAILTVGENVTITNQPDDISIDENGSATFTVNATGTGLSYQWFENGVSMGSTPASAQTKILSLTSVPLAHSGYEYKCVVSGTCTSEESDPAIVTVIGENRIIAHAENTIACQGEPFAFEVQYKNTTTACVWEYDSGSGYNPIGGLGTIVSNSTLSTLTIADASVAMNNWKFRAVVKRTGYEDNISNVVSVRVDAPASFDEIASVELCNGVGASFSVNNLTGSTPNNYQWSEGVRNLGTNSSLNLITADATDGIYSVGVTAGVCPAVVKTFTISHYDDLVLDDLIHANTLCPADDINLSVVIVGEPAQSAIYSWTKDDVNLGVTTATYDKLNVTGAESGLYKVTVKDHCMSQSKSINIDVLDIITKASADWIDQTLCVGDALLLEAKVTGDNPTYTWTVPAGSADPGNVATLKVDGVVLENAGTYTCVVSGTCGTDVTYTVDIIINDVPNITAGLEALTGVCENEPLVLGPIEYDTTTGESILWKFNDGVIGGETSESLNLANADLAEEGNYRVEVTNACGTDFSLGFQDVHPIPTLASIGNQTACQGENVIFRAVTTGEDLTYRWLIDDVVQSAYDDKSEIEISNIQPEDAYTPKNYKVECRVSSCNTDLNETAYVLVNPTTILNTSIKGEVVYVGSPYVFDLDITGSNLTYEWHHIHTDNTDEILLETSKTLTIDNLSLADAGEYSCKITGDCGVRFTSGYLTVKDPLKIVSGLDNLADIEKCFGEPLNLNISVQGEVFSINWFKGYDDLNHHELNYSIPELDVSDSGEYRCEIVGEGTSVSETVNVVVYQTTVLNSDLKDKVLCENESLLWSPDVSGSLLTYDWKHNGKTVSIDPALSISNTPMDSAGIYSVDVIGKCGLVSTEANLTLKKLPYFISKSDDLERCENDAEAIFTVNYGGDNLLYQWQKDNVDIEGANSSELTIQNLRTSDAGAYKCVVSSACGFAPENPVMNLVVIPQLKILSESPGLEICDGEEAQFIVEVDGTDEVYQWQKDGVALQGENAPQLTIQPASINEEGYYTCEISDRCTVKRYSNSKSLIVNELPNSQIFGRMTLCVLEDRVAYNTSIQPDINYGWLVEGGEFTSPSEGVKTKITWGDVIEDGKVKLKILNEATGCYSEVDSLVTLHSLPNVTLASLESKGICESEFDLGGGLPTGGIYWVNGVAQNTFDPSKGNGDYQVRYSFTDNFGCSNTTDETIMRIDSLPVVKLVEDVVVGACSSKELSAATEENNIKWSPSRYLDDPNSLTPTFTSGETTLYVATVVDKHGCVGNDIVNVTVAPLPLITTINDTIIGECKEIELTTHISGDIAEINWSNSGDLDNSKNSNPKLIKPHVGVTDYQVSVTDKYGCVGSASIKVVVLPNPEIGEDQFLCEGENLVVDIKDLSNPIWKDGYTAWERIIDKPGEYELSVEENDCELKQKIVMNPLPKFELDNKDEYPGIVIFEGETYTLDPDLDPDYGPYVYDWSDGSVLPQLVVTESGIYKLKIEDNFGCVATDSVAIEVKPIGIEAPNAFTPLSKNENDHFYLKDINVTDKFEMYIYNRWGELLYKTNEAGYANGWDGTYKGADCPVGAYVWVLMLDGKVKEKGNVILVR